MIFLKMFFLFEILRKMFQTSWLWMLLRRLVTERAKALAARPKALLCRALKELSLHRPPMKFKTDSY